MSAARRATISVCVILSLMFIVQIADDSSASYDSTKLTVTISKTEIQVGQTLLINATVNTTNPLAYEWARLIISSMDTGYIICTVNVNMTSDYEMYMPNTSYSLSMQYEFQPQKPVMFGEYTLWLTVGNISSFKKFYIAPSLADLYTDLREIQYANEIANNNYWYVIKIVYPAAFLLSAVTLVLCHYMWRMPDSNKEELKYWLMSKGDINRLKRIKRELRDLDRMSYASRNSPVVGKNEYAIRKLNNNLRVIEGLKHHTDKRVERMDRMSTNAKEFSTHLQETVDSISEEITTRNNYIEKALTAIEVEAQRANKNIKKETKPRSFEVDKLRRMMDRRREGK